MRRLLKTLPFAVGALLMTTCSKLQEQAQGNTWYVDPASTEAVVKDNY